MKLRALKLMQKLEDGSVVKITECNRAYHPDNDDSSIERMAVEVFHPIKENQCIRIDTVEPVSYINIYKVTKELQVLIGKNLPLDSYCTFEEDDISINQVKTRAEKENKLFKGMVVSVSQMIPEELLKSSTLFGSNNSI